jgi:hypothetical protein
VLSVSSESHPISTLLKYINLSTSESVINIICALVNEICLETLFINGRTYKSIYLDR